MPSLQTIKQNCKFKNKTKQKVLYLSQAFYTEQNFKCNTLVFAPIFHKLISQI